MRVLGKFLFTILVNSEQRLWYSKVKTLSFVQFSIFINQYKDNDITLQRRISKKTYTMSDQRHSNVFQGVIDRFNGVTVRSNKEPCPLADFREKLKESIEYWNQQDRKVVWFQVLLDHVGWVPILAEAGFRYHHAKEDVVMMYLWLSRDPVNIPHYAHTMLGVGAVVVNDKSQILVVSEKHYNRPHWKLPGGYVEPGENLVDAAIREVYEETNISTEFISLLNFRHTHHRTFDCSDIYVVAALKPTSENIEKCDKEIAECKWMDMEEYLNHPHVHDLNRFCLKKYLEHVEKNIKIECHHDIHQVLKVPYVVYYVTQEEKDFIDHETKLSG